MRSFKNTLSRLARFIPTRKSRRGSYTVNSGSDVPISGLALRIKNSLSLKKKHKSKRKAASAGGGKTRRRRH
jgi:hypothetical protein